MAARRARIVGTPETWRDGLTNQACSPKSGNRIHGQQRQALKGRGPCSLRSRHRRTLAAIVEKRTIKLDQAADQTGPLQEVGRKVQRLQREQGLSAELARVEDAGVLPLEPPGARHDESEPEVDTRGTRS